MTYHAKINAQDVVVAVSEVAPLALLTGETAVSSPTPVFVDQIYAPATGTFSDAPAPPPTSAQLADAASAWQEKLCDGGLTVDVGTSGAPMVVDVASDTRGRGLVTGCIQMIGLAAQNSQPPPTFQWVNNDGSTVTLTAPQMQAIGLKLAVFVQATYATLGTILAAIANGTITTSDGIAAADWPAATA